MKTSVIEVHDRLSVWSVDEVEKRIGEVPGVESVTVNYAAGNATARYDETRLEIADIRSAVRQRGHEPAAVSTGDGQHGHAVPGAPAATPAPAPPTSGSGDASTATAQQGNAAPPTAPTSSPAAPMSAAPKPPPDAVTTGDGQQGKAVLEKT